MSENTVPNRISMIFTPRERGTFKTHKDHNGDTLATPTKLGRLDMYNRIDDIISVVNVLPLECVLFFLDGKNLVFLRHIG